MYACDHGGNYPEALGKLVPKYLQSVPKCPSAGRDTYSSSWRLAGGEGFYFHFSGSHHLAAGLKANQPTFDARNGLGPPLLIAKIEAQQDLQQPQAPLQRCCQNLKNIATALEMYSTDHQGQYPKTLAQLPRNYLRKLPQCKQRNTYHYRVGVRPDQFTLYCQGQNHAAEGGRPNLPRYNSMTGLKRE